MAIARNLDKYQDQDRKWYLGNILRRDEVGGEMFEDDASGGYKVIIGMLTILVIVLAVTLIRNSVTNLNGLFHEKTECEHALNLAKTEGTMGAVFDKCIVGDGIIIDEATNKVIREW